ncbi:heme ABC transporter ATP-binding protein [Fodinicurvata halophila]|uniref:Heme ABC transporter ATP-binding protein n=1 Tax=Fodinicurvata halophila TaxID=1419723 RepID=A0ABV8ULC2_9PROT
MLSAESVCLRRGGRLILQAVDLAVKPGEFLALVGPNGAGKSTLLRLMAGSLSPTEGRVCLDGQPLATQDPRSLAQRRAVLPQGSLLNFAFTVREVVSLGRSPHRTGPARDRQVAEEVMALAEVLPLADRRYTELSGGERQRVELARVLAQIWPEPGDAPAGAGARYLLLDEPTSSLDLRHQQTVMEVARRLARYGFGVLAVLHDLNLAARNADRLALLAPGGEGQGGHLVRQGRPEQVLEASLLSKVYETPVELLPGPVDGPPVILPARA